jgi:head-tail adaptor
MGVGQMRERVKVYEITGVADGLGGETTTRTLAKECWAKVDMKGDSRTDGNSQKTIEMQIRTGSYDLTLNNLIEWRSYDYKPVSIVYDSWRRITTVTAVANE